MSRRKGRATLEVAANRIEAKFIELRAAGRKAFVAYLCAGDPDLDLTVELVCALAEVDVDIVELGIPYSDPMADGVVIQAATERALSGGTTVPGVLAAVRRIRERSQVPLLAFTYVNPLIAYGVGRFAADAAAAGIDGVLPLDLPPEEDAGLLATLDAAGLCTVRLVAPNTAPERKQALARGSRGFVYYVCRYGVTGERDSLPADLARQVAALRRASPVPVCVGFGISSPEQAAAAAEHGDGVVVGSHLVGLIERHRSDPGLVALVAHRAAELAAAVHGA